MLVRGILYERDASGWGLILPDDDEPWEITEEHNQSLDEIESLRSQLAEAEADANRYRFLRTHKSRVSAVRMDGTGHYRFATGWWPELIGSSLDAAVDAAIVQVEQQVKEADGDIEHS